MHCERNCTGILKCDKPNICTCHLTLEQTMELVSQTRDGLIIGLVFAVVAFLVCVAFLIYRYKVKSRKLKDELKSYSLRYSNDQIKVEFSYPICSSSLLDDSTQPLTDQTQRTEMNGFLGAFKANGLFNVNSLSKDWLISKIGQLTSTKTLKSGSNREQQEENLDKKSDPAV